jgi:NitT/TauT family transport system substrate-binding protein
MSLRKSLLTAVAAAAVTAFAALPAQAQQPIKMMMDWAWQGPQSPFLLADKKGYYKAENVAVQLDRGFGSARVPTELASGTYQMGFADLPTAIRFMHTNPDAGVIAVAVIFDQSPLAAITSAAGPIRTPKGLEGKKIAAPEADGGRQMFPAFAKATGIDVSKVEWLTVQPQLREPMLARGEADAITGFVTSAIMSLEAVGFTSDKQRIFRYRDHGLPFYSGAILTTRKFATENPAIVRGVVKAAMRGFQDAIRNPDEAIAALKEREALTDVAIEKRRLQIAINELMVTDSTRKNGLSFVEPARLQRNIDIVKETFSLPGTVKVSDAFDGSFLPGKDFLTVPAVTN